MYVVWALTDCIATPDWRLAALGLKVLRTDANRPVCSVAFFLLATGARLNEALSATWEHIDKTSRVWRIPATTSKSKRIRSVPLNDSAMELLGQLGSEGGSGYLFISDRTGERLSWINRECGRGSGRKRGCQTCACMTFGTSTPVFW